MNNEIKPDDFVRLTDPLDNGTIVRIENVDENGFASWLGGSQNCDMEQVEFEKTEISEFPISGEEYHYKISLTDKVKEIERDFGVKLYPESAVEYWKHRAEVAEAGNAFNDKLLDKEHNKLLDAQEMVEKERKENEELRMEVKGYIANLNKTAEAASCFIDKHDAVKRQLDESKEDILTLVSQRGK